MKKLLSVLVFSLLVAGPLLAQESAQGTQGGGESTSESNRGGAHAAINYSPVGVHIPTLVAPPVGLAFFLGNSWMLGGEYGASRFTYTTTDKDKYNLTYSNTGLNVRWFPFNSFNMLGAMHQRNFTAAGPIKFNDPSGNKYTAEFTAKANATVGSLGLSNHWLTDWHFFIGFDWGVYSLLMAHSEEVTITNIRDQNGNTVPVPSSATSFAATEAAKTSLLGINMLSALPGFLIFTVGVYF